jgi:hypothetical protein
LFIVVIISHAGCFLQCIALVNDNLTGQQSIILAVMSSHPSIVPKMPLFEDKRRLKLPTFTGLDIFQSHVKNAATVIIEFKPHIDMSKLPTCRPQPTYIPPHIIRTAPTIEDSPSDFSEGRHWLDLSGRDFTNSSCRISPGQIPPPLKNLAMYYTPREIAYLVGTPLHSIDLRNYVEQKTLSQRGLPTISDNFPLSVLNHPSSRSYIARVSVSRLEVDCKDFAVEGNNLLLLALLLLLPM